MISPYTESMQKCIEFTPCQWGMISLQTVKAFTIRDGSCGINGKIYPALLRGHILCQRGNDCILGYNKFDLFLENEEYRPFDGCKIEI